MNNLINIKLNKTIYTFIYNLLIVELIKFNFIKK